MASQKMTQYPGASATFGELVRFHRKHGTRPIGPNVHWTQKELGTACNNSVSRTVSSWENNEHFPSDISLLCKVFFGKVNVRYELWDRDLRNAFARAKGNPEMQAPPEIAQAGVDIGSAKASLKPTARAAFALPRIPGVNEVKFIVTPPPQHGANWRPDPSFVQENEGYQFAGYFEVEAAVDCDIARISLEVIRDGHLAVCTGPGKDSYYNGPLPGEKRKCGYVLINGEEEFVDASWRFLRLVRATEGQKFIVAISRWCRAIGMSKNESLTRSIMYWLDQPTQILVIEYVYGGKRHIDEYGFYFHENKMKLFSQQCRTFE